MKPFEAFEGIVTPLDRANVDTDLIIPKQFLKSVKRTGFGPYLFDQLRYMDEGQPGMDCSKRATRKEFVLNQPRYTNGSILLTKENFGCGSSREHAPWALMDYGFKVILARSFADIFYNNCFKNGLLPIVLPEELIAELFTNVTDNEGFTLLVDLKEQNLTATTGETYTFFMDSYRKRCLLEGLDDIALTLQKSRLIHQYQEKRKLECPWMFEDLKA